MDQHHPPAAGSTPVSRKTLRLTFRSSEQGIELMKVERLGMITPARPGDTPQARSHGGWWFELRDGEGRALASRVVDASLLHSVEVHSPEGRIERRFGALRNTVFEVLLPDVEGARSAARVGSPLRGEAAARGSEASGDIAVFDPAAYGPGEKR